MAAGFTVVKSLCLLGGGGSFSWPGIEVVVYVMSLPAGGDKALGYMAQSSADFFQN